MGVEENINEILEKVAEDNKRVTKNIVGNSRGSMPEDKNIVMGRRNSGDDIKEKN